MMSADGGVTEFASPHTAAAAPVLGDTMRQAPPVIRRDKRNTSSRIVEPTDASNWHWAEVFGTAATQPGYGGTFTVPAGSSAYVLLTQNARRPRKDFVRHPMQFRDAKRIHL